MITRVTKIFLAISFTLGSMTAIAETIATIKTNKGAIEVVLYDKKTPKTVANFIEYANSGFYNGTIFHRVIPNFMIQGGGFEANMVKKTPKAPIINEAQPTIQNARGTLAMARTNDPNSATSQFFINLVNNNFLNKSTAQPGYAVFGEVTKGMDVVDTIAKVKTGRKGPYGDVPTDNIVIESVKIASQPTE
ncbi:peptidylprolyl isomerase [Oleiphilus sp. HI0130]|nr:peptidylprolyl isomerase [Oleiphilus sp. HI0118]KZZ46724.1 peptidylprolyl isomerase [Oleiphilus sp. HI0118]KZZ73630.1 peptidylprolyl isomerase [Oleiphilus sp. HI0130]